MAIKEVFYRVKVIERERGYGQRSWYEYFDTKEEAEQYIQKIDFSNMEDYARTKLVPDCYIQADNKIVMVESKD